MIQVNYEELALKMREHERIAGRDRSAASDQLLRRVERLELAELADARKMTLPELLRRLLIRELEFGITEGAEE
ncbi:MAG TPA: hypothetical protein VIV56_01875 [Gemmatimonadales bacterium]